MAVEPLLRADPGTRGAWITIGVLIHPIRKWTRLPAAVIARDAVGADLLERVPQVRLAVRVVDRGR